MSHEEIEVGGGGGGNNEEEAAEVMAISERIREALECPVCLLLITEPTCRCPNGHVICYRCQVKLRNLDATRRCPMCRSPTVRGTHLLCSVTALSSFMRWIKMACSHRPYGCDELVPVIAVADHEAACPYMPDTVCQMPMCHWLGVYDGLFDHVTCVHPSSAVRSASNNLIINDVKDILINRRRSYLVKTPHGLFWVLMSVETRNRLRTSVLMVPDPDSTDDFEPSRGPPGMVFRVSMGDEEGNYRNKSRIKCMSWCSSQIHEKVNETFIMVRCKSGRLKIVWYDRHPSNRRTQQPASTPPTEVAADNSLTT